MGILDGFQFDPQSYAGGVPNWLEMALRSQGAGPSQGFPNQQQASPMSTMGGAAGYGAGMDAPPLGRPEQAQLPPTAMPVAGQGAPAMPMQAQPQAMGQPAPAPAAPGPGLFDRLSAGATNFTTGGNPIAGLLNMMGGLATGQRTDRTGIAQQNQQATASALYHALSKSGRYSPEEAKGIAIAAATNPALAAALLPQAFGSKYEFKTLKGPLGDESLVATNPIEGTAKPVNLDGGAGGGPGGPQMLASGVKKYDPYLSADEYLAQFSPDVQAVMQQQLRGDAMPTGNPRAQQLWSTSKGFTSLYAQKAGIPFSDEIYAGKRKFHTELGSNSAGTAGGQAKAFVQGIEHAVDLADTLKKLDNSNGLGIPLVAQGVNTVRQAISNDQQALADKAQGIGQTLAGEVGKLFSGSAGGGVHEREMTRARFDTVRSKPQLAAALEATLETMEGGLTAIENRRDQMLGPNSGVQLVPQQTREKINQLRGIIGDLKGQAPAKGAAPSQATADPIAQARDAITRGAPREAVIQRLRQHGVDPAGL